MHFIFATIIDIILNTSKINRQNKQIVKSVDFLVKTITPEGNKPFLDIYNDASVERKIINFFSRNKG